MKKLRFPNWTVPIALLVICLISFGVMANKLGFYWDDWTIAYYIHFLGPSSFREAFAVDRPLLAWIYILTTSALGTSPLNWQIFAIFTRWTTCLALWWMLKGLWPHKRVQIASIALLFAVYPGFQQGFIAITYGNGFMVHALFLTSMGAMVWALRKPQWFWPLYLLSIVLAGYTLFTVELFFGLELLRPVLIWLILSESVTQVRKRIQRVGLYWIPYAILALIFLTARLLSETPRGKITIFERMSTSPGSTLIELGQTILQDLVEVTALAWKQALNFFGIMAYEPVTILKYVLIVLGLTTLTILLLVKLSAEADAEQRDRLRARRYWGLQALLLGFFALVVAGIPIWMTNLRITLSFPWDRFTVPMMIGASLLLTGLIEVLTWKRMQSAILIGIAVGVAGGMHFQTSLKFRKDWLTQRDFFWQLTWRAPGIQPGTVILTSEMPFLYDWDNSLTAPLNWTYAPENSSRELPYLIYNVESRLSSDLPELEKDSPIREIHRITPFNGSTSQTVLVFYRPPGSCVKLVDPITDQRLPDKPRYFHDALLFSNPDLILPNANPPAQPPAPFFNPEPEHSWCYYYEKAELARQQGNWQEVVMLGDKAFGNEEAGLQKEFFRKNAAELIPFIEGYAHTGQWSKAVKLSQQAYQAWENMRYMLCDTWEDIHQSTPANSQGQAAFDRIQQILQCSVP